MCEKLKKMAAKLLIWMTMLWTLGLPVFAGNPDTGDGSGTMIAIMVGVMIVAVVVIVIFFATGKKK